MAQDRIINIPFTEQELIDREYRMRQQGRRDHDIYDRIVKAMKENNITPKEQGKLRLPGGGLL